jgi:hypothetical protein
MTKGNGQNTSVPVVIENPPSPEKVTADSEQEQSDDNSPLASGQSETASERKISAGNNRERTAGRVAQPAPAKSAEVNRAGKVGSIPLSASKPAVKSHTVENYRFMSYKSPLTRIREAAGGINSMGLRGYFVIEPGCPMRQEPAAVLTDGNTSVAVVMELVSQGGDAPTFLLKGAHCISLKQRDTFWVMEVMPHSGVLEATVSAMYDDMIVQFPLTLAPPLDYYLKNRPAFVESTRTDLYVHFVNNLVNGIKH